MTPIEYIILGILAVFAALVGSFALRNSGERAVQEDIKELSTVRSADLDGYLLLIEEERWKYRQAQKRREATERAWSKHHAAYAPRRDAVRQRARKKP